MSKKRTKAEQFAGMAEVITQINKTGDYKKPTQTIQTKPIIDSVGDNNEKAVQTEIKSCVFRLGGVCHVTTTGKLYTPYGKMLSVGIPGLSDIIAVINGRYVEIECKARNGGRLSRKQINHGKGIVAAGGIWLIGHSADEVKYKLQHDYREPYLDK